MADIGKIAAQVIVDTKGSDKSLRDLDVAAKSAEKSLVDLAATSGNVGQQLTAGFKNISQIRTEINKLDLQRTMSTDRAEVDGLTARIKELDHAMAGLTGRGLRQLRMDVRDEDFLIRRSSQGLIALTFALTMFERQSGGGSKAVKEFTSALKEGAEITMFTRLGLEMFGGAIGQVALPIGIAAGALTMLISLLTGTNEAAKKAAEEGLKSFAESIKGLRVEDKVAALGNVTKALEAQEKKLEEFKKRLPEGSEPGSFAFRFLQPEAYADIGALEHVRDILQANKEELTAQIAADKAIAEQAAITNGLIGERLNRIQQINLREKELKDAQEKGLRFNEDGLKISDEMERLAREKKNLTASTSDIQKDQLDDLKHLHDTEKLSSVEYLRQLGLLGQMITEKKLMVEIEDQIHAVQKKQTEEIQKQIEKRFAEQSKYAVSERNRMITDREDMGKLEDKLDEEAVKNKYDREIKAAKDEFEKHKEDILKKTHFEDDRNALLAKAKSAMNTKIANIEEGRTKEDFERTLEKARTIEEVLTAAFGRSGDELVNKLEDALRIAILISKVMQLFGLASLFSIFAPAAAAGAAGGAGVGATGGGVGMVPLIPKMTAHIPTGLPSAATAVVSNVRDESAGAIKILTSELRALRADVQNLKIQAPVVIQGHMDGQTFLKKQDPIYRKYLGDKQV